MGPKWGVRWVGESRDVRSRGSTSGSSGTEEVRHADPNVGGRGSRPQSITLSSTLLCRGVGQGSTGVQSCTTSVAS